MTETDKNDDANAADAAILRRYWHLLAAILAGAAGSGAYFQVNPPRPDPFTGTEGRLIESRVGRLEERVSGHVTWAADKREALAHDYNELEARVQILEAKVQQLERRVERLYED